MKKFEYKSIMLEVERNFGVWNRSVDDDSVNSLEKALNEWFPEGHRRT